MGDALRAAAVLFLAYLVLGALVCVISYEIDCIRKEVLLVKMLFRGKRTELAHGVTVEPGKVYEVDVDPLTSGYLSATIGDGEKFAPCWYASAEKFDENWLHAELDPVAHPGHYAGDGEVDCMRAMRSMVAGYGEGEHVMADYWCITALKYLWRWPRKNGLQDLKKARQCIGYAIEEVEREG